MTRAIEPTKKDIGRRVVYIGRQLLGFVSGEGVIVDFTDNTVFVRYEGRTFVTCTPRQDLEWAKTAVLTLKKEVA